MRVLEADGQGAALEDGLEGIGAFARVVARDGNAAVRNFGLHSRCALHLIVQDDDDLTMRRIQVARRIGEALRTIGVERQVDSIISRSLAFAVDVNALDVIACHDRRIRTVRYLKVDGFSAGKRIAEAVVDDAFIPVLPLFDLALYFLVGERVKTGELEFARLADSG